MSHFVHLRVLRCVEVIHSVLLHTISTFQQFKVFLGFQCFMAYINCVCCLTVMYPVVLMVLLLCSSILSVFLNLCFLNSCGTILQVETVAQFGVIFLLFALGLEFSTAKVGFWLLNENILSSHLIN